MKSLFPKAASLLFAAMLCAVPPAPCEDGRFADTRMEKAGDWFATLGKSGGEKSAILLRRRTERRALKAQRYGEQMARDRRKNAARAQEAAEKRARRIQKERGLPA